MDNAQWALFRENMVLILVIMYTDVVKDLPGANLGFLEW